MKFTLLLIACRCNYFLNVNRKNYIIFILYEKYKSKNVYCFTMTKTNLQTVFVVTFAVAMLGVASVTPVFAAPVLNPANGHHYELISTILSWTDAKSAAETSVFQGVNGHLVTITSADENAFVEGIVPDSTIVWIGFTDEVIEGTFEWVTAEPVIYTNWNAGEPNDSSATGEDYGEFL